MATMPLTIKAYLLCNLSPGFFLQLDSIPSREKLSSEVELSSPKEEVSEAADANFSEVVWKSGLLCTETDARFEESTCFGVMGVSEVCNSFSETKLGE
jgi:hypothetical protein